MSLAAGSRIGRYEVVSLLGAGGMGEVYRARDTTLDRHVAIKVLPHAFVADAERVTRFEREARTLAALNHPHIASIYGIEAIDGINALVLELVDGPTLADRIAEGAMPVEDALAIAQQIAQALEVAHDQGIVHRDLKPANIKLRPDGAVKVLDFGLAKLTTGPDTASRVDASLSPTVTGAMMTGAGVLLGTAAYMPPEQAKGRTVDRRADVWAFGCVVFEMLTGRQAFGGDTLSEILAEVLKSDPDWSQMPAAVPARVVTVLQRCLEKNPARRIRDMGDVRLALDGAFETVVPATPAATAQPAARPRWRAPAAIAAAFVIGTVASALAALLMLRTPTPGIARFQIPLPPGSVFSGTGRNIIALSRDGRLMAYSANNRIHLRRLDSLVAAPVRGTEDGSGRTPFFSPDGQWLGFFSNTGLKRVAVSGGAPVLISAGTQTPWGVSWEDDGTILYGLGPEGVWRVPASGGQPERLFEVASGENAHGPQLLPGGTWVLFTLRPNGSGSWDDAQIVARSLSTGERKVLVSGGRDGRYVASGHLVYNLRGVLMAVPFDLRSIEVRGGPVSVLEGVGTAGANSGAAFFVVSDTGSLVYVPAAITGGGASPRMMTWVTPAGKEEPVAGLQPAVFNAPALSPDGSRIAVTIQGTNEDIWTWDVARQTMTRLTFDAASDQDPLWTLDGTRIVFRSLRDGGGLFSQRADGTGRVERLLQSGVDFDPFSWTRDGSLLMGPVRDTGSPRDVVILKAGGAPAPLLASEFTEHRPAVSPNGRWLAYESEETGQPEIYVRPFPAVDEGKWQVSREGGAEPRWSADGRALHFLGRDAMMRVDIGAGPAFTFGAPVGLFPLTPFTLPAAVRRYDLAPDGRFLMLKTETAPREGDQAAGTPHLVLVQHWLEELKRAVPRD